MTTISNQPTITAGVHATKSLATCARLLALAGLDEMLEGEGRFTLFAPTDSAFAALPPGALHALENDPAQLRAMLEYHILIVDRELNEIRDGKLATLEGTLLTASITDDGLRLDRANTSGYPLRCANGMIHQIDAVLFPGIIPKDTAAVTADSPWAGRKQTSRFAPPAPATGAQAAEAAFNSPPGPA